MFNVEQRQQFLRWDALRASR